MQRKVLTLVMVRNAVGEVLLGLKKRGFGVGKWNGFGGKVEPGETIPEAASRELTEECGLVARTLTTVGCIDFEFVNDPVIMEVHVFSTSDYEGEVVETEEMKPKWYRIEDIPFDDMWLDDKIWIQWYLKGDHFKAHFLYEGHDKILSYEMEPIKTSPAVITTFNKR